jgi:hypothetical protein
MPYCPKCGNKVDENVTICQNCGAPLSGGTPNQPSTSPPAKPENAETQEKHEGAKKSEKHEKSDNSFIGFLVGGLILITVGVFALIDLTSPNFLSPTQDLAAMLLIIGVIIIIAAIYIATRVFRHFPGHPKVSCPKTPSTAACIYTIDTSPKYFCSSGYRYIFRLNL